jgi:hypothetical protein
MEKHLQTLVDTIHWTIGLGVITSTSDQRGVIQYEQLLPESIGENPI